MSTVKKPSFYNNVEDVLKRSVITEGFEKLAAVPTYRSEKLLKRERAVIYFLFPEPNVFSNSHLITGLLNQPI